MDGGEADVDPRVRPWLKPAADAIELKLVRSAEDVDGAEGFHPEFTHQVVGQSEMIYGYKQPKVRLYYSAARLNAFLSFSHEGVVTDLAERDGLDAPPDEPVQQIKEWLQHDHTSNVDEFVLHLKEEAAFVPCGELVHSYSRPDNKENGNRSVQFEIYQGDAETPGMVEYHKRAQTFCVWYIEAASLLELDDPRWRLFHLFERRELPDGGTQYCFAGLITLYEYYAYPDNVRPRVSQVLVLPPFQRAGHGAELLRTVYDHCARAYSKGKVVDITVEDPSPSFTRLRDRVDAENCWRAFPPDFWRGSWSDAKATAVREKLLIGKAQARRVFEILQLRALNTGDPALLRPYRLAIKKRLIQPHMKQKKNEEQQLMSLSPEERAAIVMQQQELQESLHTQYESLVEEYRNVLESMHLE